MKKRKEVATQQQIEWLKKRVVRLEENTLQLKNQLHHQGYLWDRQRKSIDSGLGSIIRIAEKNKKKDSILTTIKFYAFLSAAIFFGYKAILIFIAIVIFFFKYGGN